MAKKPLEPPVAADISFRLLKFENGIVVRFTITIVEPHDNTIRVFGDDCVITLNDS